MTLKFYNTLSKELEEFKPLHKDLVKLYTCGPTIYNYVHIGNLRTYVFQDILRRYLQYKGYNVRQVMNLTDVDDKTIRDSIKEGEGLSKFTAKFARAFVEDLKSLNIELPEIMCSATAHIKEMVMIIQKLMQDQIAYRGKDGSIYYDISKFKNYGELAHIDVSKLKAGARVAQDEYEKENASDFALWKSWDELDGNVFWETEIGKGRPGWHIECSAMSMKYLGDSFDIHTGGVDLVFPHHTNEIAQSEAYSGKKFVKYWLHAEHLIVDGKKMSKSLGNFYTLRDLMKKNVDLKAVRYLLFSTHYRQQLNFTFESLDGAKASVERLLNFMSDLKNLTSLKNRTENNTLVPKLTKSMVEGFETAMDNDLNTSEALASVFNFVSEINKLKLSAPDARKCIDAMNHIDRVLGILEVEEDEIDDDVEDLLEEREKERKAKNYSNADVIRQKIETLGYVVEDTEFGAKVKKK